MWKVCGKCVESVWKDSKNSILIIRIMPIKEQIGQCGKRNRLQIVALSM